jgi:hypothetical protein
MVKRINKNESRTQDLAHGEGAAGETPALMAPEDVQRARRRFIAWIRWYMDMYPDEIPSQTTLARRLGITPAAVTYLLDPAGTRAPAFATLLAAKALLGGISIDTMLFTDPPVAPSRRTGR